MLALSIVSKFKSLINPIVVVIVLPLVFISAKVWSDEEASGMFIPANTVAKNFYGGIGVGVGKSDSPDSNQDGSVSNISDDDRDTTLTVTAGYQINENVAMQGAYKDLGETDFRGESTGGPSWSPGSVRTEQDAESWELGILGRWPVSDRWYALGFIGLSWWENNERYTESGFVSTLKETGSDATFALGFEFDHGLKDRIVYRFMGSHHSVGDDNYDINDISGEVIYRFP